MSTIDWHLANVKLSFSLFSSLVVLGIGTAAAEPPSARASLASKPKPQLWMTSGFRSWHFNRAARYNEQNTGMGFEWRLDEQRAWTGGLYYNSVRDTSHYLHYAWTPVRVGAVRIGGAAGMIDGYPELRDGKLAFSLIPVATMDFRILQRDAGINIVYIPTIAERVDGSLAVQFRIRMK